MGNKEKLASLLARGGDEFISGSTIAEELGVSRAAVWKNIKALEKAGYRIEAVNNKGYRLAADNDVTDRDSVLKYIGGEDGPFTLEVYESIGSTNTALKERAETLPDWTIAVAGEQSEGRGRTGRSFYSPAGTGVYLSVLMKENIRFADAGRLTTAAAIAACRAIEECTDSTARIKWVNDVFVNGKKTCGILTEASVNYETGMPDWIVTGIGFNVYEPEGGFPEEIAYVAGAVTAGRQKDLRSRIAAAFVKHFRTFFGMLQSPGLYREYRERCFMIGRPIFVLNAGMRIPATALDINEDFALLVRYEDGREETLRAGEVSIRTE